MFIFAFHKYSYVIIIILLFFTIQPIPTLSRSEEWPPYPEPERPEPGELFDRAVVNYNRGRFVIASNIAGEIRRLDPGFLEKNADFRRLLALLSLQGNRMRPFFAAVTRDPLLKEDTYLNYIAGIIALRSKRHAEAVAHFRIVVAAPPEPAAPESGLYPFHCAESPPRSDIPLRLPIGPLERGLSAFMIRTLEKGYGTDRPPEPDSDLGPLRVNQPLLVALLLNPGDDGAHLQCIASFRKSGATAIPSLASIRFNFPDTTELHRNRVRWIGGPIALSGYGEALNQAKRFAEALHAYRLALSEAGWERIPAEGEIHPSIRRILAGLERSYTGLKSEADAMTMRRFQRGLPMAEAKEGIPIGESDRRRLLDLCTENLKNRESLLMLAAESTRIRGTDGGDYEKMLAERDAEQDMIELRSALEERFPY
jgi:tetratricopeptide (TPR) repeat protein